MTAQAQIDFTQLAAEIKSWGRALGFQEVGISDTELTQEENYLQQWLHGGYHGDMDYMARHGTARTRPGELVPGTVRIISVRLNYRPPGARDSWETMDDPDAAFIRATRLGATITRYCVRSCSRWQRRSNRKSARSSTASSPIRHP
jgi:epoxyqueuosine reductase